MKIFFQSIKVKLLLTLLAFGLIPFVIISTLSMRTIRVETREEIVDKLILFVDAKAEELFAYLNLMENRTVDFAADQFIVEQMEIAMETDGDTSEVSSVLSDYLTHDKRPLDEALMDVFIMEPAGFVVGATRSSEVAQDYSALVTQKLQMAFLADFQGVPSHYPRNAFVVATPLYRASSDVFLGTLVAIFNPDKLESLLAKKLGFDPRGDYLLKGSPLETVEVYLVNKNREIFIHPHASTATTRDFFGIKANTLPVEKCLENQEAIRGELYRNYDWSEVIGVSVCFPDQGWVIVSEITAKEAFLPLNRVYLRLGFFIALFFLTVLLFALVLSRRVTEPLQEMMRKVEQVREGNLDVQVHINSQDEIGALAKAFNETTQKLKKSYSSLEKKVQEKTSELHDKVIKINQEKVKDEAILASIGDGIIMTDQYGKIALVNNAAQEILLWDFTQVYGKKLAEVMPLTDVNGNELPADEQPLFLALSRLQRVAGTYYFLNGKVSLPITITVSPVMLDKTVVGSIMVFRDVTKEKEVDRMKNEFVSLVSHQLRTPLSGMKWFSEMLLDGDAGKLNANQKEFIGNISQLNNQMIVLVNALLNISRIESGRIIIEPEPTNLGDLVDDVLTALRTRIKEKNIDLVVSINKRIRPIKIDPKLIREVYSNLLSNAIKYTPEGGEISIFISEKEDQIISQITDTGYGIPAKEQHKLFQKFFRASNIISVETDGNGLGMYLVKAIVESSGGRIWFKSEEGKGSSFWFSLPKKGSPQKSGAVSLNT